MRWDFQGIRRDFHPCSKIPREKPSDEYGGESDDDLKNLQQTIAKPMVIMGIFLIFLVLGIIIVLTIVTLPKFLP